MGYLGLQFELYLIAAYIANIAIMQGMGPSASRSSRLQQGLQSTSAPCFFRAQWWSNWALPPVPGHCQLALLGLFLGPDFTA